MHVHKYNIQYYFYDSTISSIKLFHTIQCSTRCNIKQYTTYANCKAVQTDYSWLDKDTGSLFILLSIFNVQRCHAFVDLQYFNSHAFAMNVYSTVYSKCIFNNSAILFWRMWLTKHLPQCPSDFHFFFFYYQSQWGSTTVGYTHSFCVHHTK